MGSIYIRDVLKVAEDNIGYHEGPNNWTIFAKVLDDCGYYAPQKKQNVAWCATFCNYCMLKAAIPEDRDDDSKKYDAQNFMYQPSYNNYSAAANLMAGYFKNAGEFYDDPEVGDMIFFKMSDGSIGHVGIVEDTDGCITTIEGNAGDQVQRKWYDYGDDRIAGFGRPSYDGYEQDSDDSDDKPTPAPDPTPEPTPAPDPVDDKVLIELDVLERYSTGGQVNTLKALLKEFDYGGDELVLDGDFDWATEQAVLKFQELHDMEQTGIVDKEFWEILLK